MAQRNEEAVINIAVRKLRRRTWNGLLQMMRLLRHLRATMKSNVYPLRQDYPYRKRQLAFITCSLTNQQTHIMDHVKEQNG